MVIYRTNHITAILPSTSTMMIHAIKLLMYVEYILYIRFIGLIFLSLESTIDCSHHTTANNNNNTKELICMKQLSTIFIVSSVLAILMTIMAMVDEYLVMMGNNNKQKSKNKTKHHLIILIIFLKALIQKNQHRIKILCRKSNIDLFYLGLQSYGNQTNLHVNLVPLRTGRCCDHC